MTIMDSGDPLLAKIKAYRSPDPHTGTSHLRIWGCRRVSHVLRCATKSLMAIIA